MLFNLLTLTPSWRSVKLQLAISRNWVFCQHGFSCQLPDQRCQLDLCGRNVQLQVLMRHYFFPEVIFIKYLRFSELYLYHIH